MDRVNSISKQVCAKSYHTADLTRKFGNLKNRNLVISGASRGIGLAIAKRWRLSKNIYDFRAAKDGANIAILAKTTTPQPNLPGTIYTAAEELRKLGAGKVLPIKCDIRFEVILYNNFLERSSESNWRGCSSIWRNWYCNK